MKTDRLWAPWRVEYITNIDKKKKGCVFCRIAKSRQDAKNRVFLRTKYCYAVLNTYPYNNGHVLLLPRRHVNDLSKLKPQEKEELYGLLETTKTLLDKILKPHGYNIGLNLGRVAGAGFPGHLHFHVVPRWKGDVNFMPVLAETKVISQSLDALYERLINA